MMDSILDALHEGRLIELPDDNKEDALRLLAHMIEAIPSVPVGTDVAGLVFEREKNYQTSIGLGWACPHARLATEGDLLCAIGWSPTGIDYGSPEKEPVRIIVMYLVPDNQKNSYLKEVSTIVKVLKSDLDLQHLESAEDLNSIRTRLLGLIASVKEGVDANPRARMIQLEVRQEVRAAGVSSLDGLVIEPLTIIAVPDFRPVVLTHNKELMRALEASQNLVWSITEKGRYDHEKWRIIPKSSVLYQGEHVAYECLAVRSA